MTIVEYIKQLDKRLKSGLSGEHTYRGDIESLIKTLASGIEVTNEPQKVTDCGNPDFVVTKGKIPIGYIEAKDIGKDLNSKNYKEQFERYKKALDNLIITDYLYFQFFRHGQLIHEIKIGEIDASEKNKNNGVRAFPENFSEFENLIKNFCLFIGQTIKSSKKLAEMMASKARLLKNILERAVSSDEDSEENTSLREQYKTFKNILIHDLSPKAFADIYAQTLAYGMFAARLHDTSLDDFSRQEAAELIPKTNPFLRKLFAYVAGPDIDERIMRTVDNLAQVFRATNVEELLKNFGASTQTNDPIIHFYETFLSEYDPKLRKARGVFYTPQAVVGFIVRSVDEILKSEFNLSKGLADTSKTKIKVPVQGDLKNMEEKEVHRVQILDPATGTGTFLAEAIKHIYRKNFNTMQGAWSGFVEEHLIPRLNGFELLMASYSMAHLKLDMLLKETGYKPSKSRRFNVFLTNSLEEYHPDTGTLFANWLSTEANEANHIKRDTPVMCVIGNPPYSGESANKGEWIMNLLEVYKKEPGGKEKLNERNPKWINDDYVKFIRYSSYLIEKNGEGVLGFINPHGFLDNPTFRGMRWHLLKTFDTIYTIDLHGNSKKKEVCPDGSPDQNVFDIMQGVAITLFIKTGKKNKNELGRVFHYDLYGKREYKYEFLNEHTVNNIPFAELKNNAPNYFFVPKNFEVEKEYEKGFKINDLFSVNNVGIVTSRDKFVIDDNKEVLGNRIKDFFILSKQEIQNKYKLKENKSWKIENIKVLAKNFNTQYMQKISYRPFDIKYIYYDKDFIERSRSEVMQHFLNNENLGLVLEKIIPNKNFNYRDVYITKHITDSHLIGSATYNYPLYLYPTSKDEILKETKREPNLNKEIIKTLENNLNLTFTPEKEEENNTFAPIDVFDYIYAVLHSPSYRKKYKEFLKIDFPRVPYPKNKKTFWNLVKLGSELRCIHLLENPKLENFITGYPIDGDNVITTSITKKDWEINDAENRIGKIWINEQQYFENIPVEAWEFYIGGYRPAQKWLKDRKGKILNFEDIVHYQKIIAALFETSKIMQEINKIEIE
ncbi:MAG: DNA methyltransferase [Treponema sp.]|nr:MAG: DNA methyltransferase [Treponema sp.]